MDGQGAKRALGGAGLPGGVAALVVVLVGFLAYSNTFRAPFVYEDAANVVRNPAIGDISYLKDPSKAAGTAYADLRLRLKSRPLTYLSFYACRSVFGRGAFWFHAVNTAIHLANAVLIWVFARLLLRRLYCGSAPPEGIALLAALLFAAHPVQTEAVTYISQRSEGLAAMFSLLSAAAYIGSRQSAGALRRYALYAAALGAASFAMKSRENALALPVLLALVELLLFEGYRRRRALLLVPFVALMLIVPIGSMEPGQGFAEAGLKARIYTTARALATYLRLLLLPVNQNADYDYPLYRSAFEAGAALSLLPVAALLALSVFILLRPGRWPRHAKLIALGCPWFLAALFVDAVVTPFFSVNEHRLYLPSVGAFLALSSGLHLIVRRLNTGPAGALAPLAIAALPFVLAAAAYSRNAVWQSDVSLWEDAARKSPWKAGAHSKLGAAYLAVGRKDDALRELWTAVNLDPDSSDAYAALGAIYMEKGLYEKAVEILNFSIALDPGSAESYNSLGLLYGRAGDHALARDMFLRAIALRPDYAEAHTNLAMSLTELGDRMEAVKHYREALRLDPTSAVANNNLGLLYEGMGDAATAEAHYLNAVRLDPSFARAYNNLGRLYYAQGLVDPAEESLQRAVSRDPDLAEAHFNLGVIYLRKGLREAAVRKFERVLELRPDDKEAGEYLEKARKGG